MFKIQYQDSKDLHDCESFFISGHLLHLINTVYKIDHFPRAILLPSGPIIADVTQYKTLYRVTDNEIIFSDDNSMFTEKFKSISLNVVWERDTPTFRPTSFKVTIIIDGIEVETVIMSKDTNWSYTINHVPVKSSISIRTKSPSPYYQLDVKGTTIYLRKEEDHELKDNVDLLMGMVVDLDDRVYALESV